MGEITNELIAFSQPAAILSPDLQLYAVTGRVLPTVPPTTAPPAITTLFNIHSRLLMIVYWIIEQDREGPQQPPATTLLRAGLAALHSGQTRRERVIR